MQNNRDTDEIKNKKKKKIGAGHIALIIGLALLAAALIGALAFQKYWNKEKERETFLDGTTINGSDVSGKTPEEVTEALAEQCKDFSVEIDENGTAVLTGTASQFGYTPDTQALSEKLQDALKAQTSDFARMMQLKRTGESLTETMSWAFDESTFDSFVQSANFSVPRTATQDPELTQSDDGTYTVTDGSKGNEVDDTALQSFVKEQIDQAVANGTEESGVTMTLPDSVYTSADPDESLKTSLQQEADEKNKAAVLDKYQNMSVTYEFGTQTEVLDANTIMGWLSVADDGSITVDQDAVSSYVSDLASKYNTRYIARTFTATDGEEISFSAGSVEYGYTIDQDAECKQLTADIETGEPVSREPEYIQTNDYGNPLYLGREGTDDLNGTYVEVDISSQHIWFYKNGTLVVDSDCVTGDASKGFDTEIGIFPLAYKESPSVLTGQNANGNDYETKVSFWMPFFEGEGLHDATWRSAFGGDIYKTNGSHGCVNLPYDTAEKIYDNIDAGTAIVIHE